MSETIDSLDIQIKASASKANDSVESLIGKLGRLSTSIGTLDTSKLQSLSNGIGRLSTSMQSMKSVGTADFTRLAKNIEKLGSLDSVSLSRSASSLHRFSNSLAKLDSVKVSDNAAQIGTLAKGIAQLGYKSSTKAIDNIPKLATAMRKLMTELSKAPKVSQSLIDMTNALAKLGRTGASSGRAATSLSRALNTYTSSTSRAKIGTFSLASAIGKLYATYWLLFRAFSKIGEAIDISSQLTEVQNVVDVTFGNMAYKVEDFAKTSIEQFGMSELALKKYSSRFQAMGSAIGIDNSLISNANSFLNQMTNGYVGLSDSMSDVSLNLTKLTADMASFYNVEQSEVAEDLEAIFTGMTRPLRTYGLDLTEATLREWAMKNGLDANIESMSQAQKTMLRYQYVLANTGASQGDFARTADTWANQIRILKNNFQQLGAVIGGTFINALKPLVRALNEAMSYITSFAKTVSNALGKIFGWKYEDGSGGITSDLEDAADGAGGIASGIGDAADNAKKLKNYLLGIDELNVLNSNSDSSSGTGSSGGGTSSGSTGNSGQWVKTDGILKEFESEIGTLYELGAHIGDTIKESLSGIDWNSVYSGAKNFGSGFASFLNGLISPEMFGEVGKTIANSLNTAIYASLSFGETFDASNLGESIGKGINEFFLNFDFKALAESINVWVDNLEGFLGSALKEIDWINVLKGIGDFLGELDIDTISFVVGAITLKHGGKILTSSVVKKIIQKELIPTGIVPLTASLLFTFTIADIGFDNWKNENNITEEDLKSAFSGTPTENMKNTWEKDKSSYRYRQQKEASEYWSKVFEDLKKGKLLDPNSQVGLLEIVLGYDPLDDSHIEDTKDKVNIFVKSGISSPLLTDLKEAFKKENFLEFGNNMKNGISEKWDEFTRWWNSTGFVKWWTNDVSPWFTKEKWQELGGNIKYGLQTKWDEFTSWWKNTGIYKWWYENVSPWFTRDKWISVSSGMKTGIQEKWNSFTSWWNSTGIYNWWNNNVTPWFTKDKWSSVSVGMKDGLSQKWNDFTDWWNGTGFARWWDDVKKNFSKDSWSFSGIKDGLLSSWNAAIEAIKGTWNSFATWLNAKLTLTIDTSTTIGSAISTALGGVTSIALGSIPTFAGGGFPTSGELFVARENGLTEMVGSFGNRTAVANNDQIVEGIAYGVSSANEEQNRLLREQNDLLRRILAKDTSINIGDREIAKANIRGQRAIGMNLRTT